ncbi:MAG: PVC-type heme-binding CxxCH protein [Pirellulales bacterium]
MAASVCARTGAARFAGLVLLAACAFAIASIGRPAFAQRGQFDANPVSPADEAYIFTPRGFAQEGKPAVAGGANTARLNVTITDRASGEPTFCRVNVVGSDGNYYQPKNNPLIDYSLRGTWPDTLAGNRPGKAPIRYFGRFFYTSGEFAVEVPTGPVRVEVWKGFEYRPVTRSVDLAAGTIGDVKLSLERTVPMADKGWYSGDPHLHFIRTGEADEKKIFDLLEAEDIRFGMVLAYNETNAYPGVMAQLATPQLRGLGTESIRRRGDYQIVSGQEYRNVVFGHVLLFLRDSLVLEGQNLDPNLGPVFGQIGEETQKLGGYAFHAHGGYAQEIWADLVQGATNGVELLQFGIYRGIGLDGWYHVLGSGFRFPGIGACDYPACRKLGDCRTYVHLDGEPTFAGWLEGAALGRSFMTSGPLVLLEVDGRRPGDTIATSDSKPLSLKIRVVVSSETARVSDVQLVVNGRVARELRARPLPGEPQELVLEETLEVSEPSWIAARAFSTSPTGSPDAEAHTNPVYVYLNGRRPYSEADADWLVARLDEQIADHEARDVPERKVPVEYFRRSRDILLDIKKRGGLAAADDLKSANADDQASREVRNDVRRENPPTTDGSLAEILKPVPAKSPADALKTFEVLDGFRMELVAHEPDVTDPVAACFDENGGLYVAEMIDYPYRPKEGQQPLGRVRYLADSDGDGRYEKSWIFADHLAWPTGVACWKGGVYVAAAPDIWYCRDTDGDHAADERKRIYTGFGDRNQQGGVNNLNWGIDHKIYGAGSTNGGEIRPAIKGDATPVSLSGRDFRFDPVTGAFETITGREQFGNAFDDWFNRFICSESNPLVHVVLPQHYLARNPFLAVPSGLKDLSPGVTPIFRISPIEKWREIRSSRRLAADERSPLSAGLSHHVMDAAAGLTVYRGHAYPERYRGDVFVGCSQNNLIHRRKLIPDGASFRSVRADEKTEFVRSTDTWFRPVNCIGAPDGTIYVLDMAREVIESIHIASDVVAHLDLTNGRDKGRIYRLAPPGFQTPPQPKLAQATTADLAALLEHPGGWWRDTASRLIFERQDRSIVELLRRRSSECPAAVGRVHILWALEGLGALEEQDVRTALADASPRVRDHAARLAATSLGTSPGLVGKVVELAADDDPAVRFQVAFALGETDDPRAVEALAAIAARDAADEWIRVAVLSSCTSLADRVLLALAGNADFLAKSAAETWLVQLATIVGARNESDAVERVLGVASDLPAESVAQRSIVLGLGGGLRRSGRSLADAKAATSAAAAGMLTEMVELAVRTAGDADATSDERMHAVRLLGVSGSGQTVDALVRLIDPVQPEALQIVALTTLSGFNEPSIADNLVDVWQRSTPGVQEQIIVTLSSRPAWALKLLDACGSGKVNAGQISGPIRTALVNHQDAAVVTRAEKLFAAGASPRSEVIAQYQRALSHAGDAARGNQIFERECMACHRLGDRGFQVGPNLALVRNRTDAAMLEAILDPNREVQPRYVNYVVVDSSGRTTTGLVVAETATSVTLARDKGASETILKKNIDQIKSTGKSLMPEGLEKTVEPQAVADLLAFLKEMQYDVGTLPDFAEPED